MRRHLRVFLLRVLVLVPVFCALWIWRGSHFYETSLAHVARPLYQALGVSDSTLAEAYQIILGRSLEAIVPLLVLTLAIVGLTLRRRAAVLGGGILLLATWHLATPLIVRQIIMAHQLDRTAYVMITPLFLLTDALPLVYWILTARPTSLIDYKPANPTN